MKKILLFLLLLLIPRTLAAQDYLLLSTCMSLRTPVTLLARRYQEEKGMKVRINAASSGRLALQIEKGAPVDIFISASTRWMDRLEKAGLIIPSTRVNLLSNSLVLAAPPGSPLSSLKDLTSVSRLVIGDYHFAPFGLYAKEALEALGLWKKLVPRIILANHAGQAVTWLMTGNADAGIIYYSDYVTFQDRLKLVARIPPSLHSPITYWMAVVKGTTHPDQARALERFLSSTQATKVFLKYGFSPPPGRKQP